MGIGGDDDGVYNMCVLCVCNISSFIIVEYEADCRCVNFLVQFGVHCTLVGGTMKRSKGHNCPDGQNYSCTV